MTSPDWGPPPADWVDEELVARAVDPRPWALPDRDLTIAERHKVVREINRRGGGTGMIVTRLGVSGETASRLLREHRAREAAGLNDDQDPCNTTGCTRPARMAIRTTRRSREVIETKVYWDDRSAPRVAERLCREHGLATLDGLGKALITPDEAADTKAGHG